MTRTSGRLGMAPGLRQRLLAHAARVHPVECCGLLLGRGAPEREVLVVVESENVAPHPELAFELEPGALLEAERLARAQELEVLGVYHSHPSGPTWPSSRDTAPASWSQVVVSTAGVRSFRGEAPLEEDLV